jgi:hypothetical protein
VQKGGGRIKTIRNVRGVVGGKIVSKGEGELWSLDQNIEPTLLLFYVLKNSLRVVVVYFFQNENQFAILVIP